MAVLLAHDSEPHLRRTDERGDVDGAAAAREVREVSVQIAPIFLYAVLLHPHGIVDDKEVRERCDGAALARDLGRNALTDLAEHAVVDQDVCLGLAEHVDESGCDHQARHVDRVSRLRAAEVSHRRDTVAADGDVAAVSRVAAAVHDPAATQDQVVGAVTAGRRAHPAPRHQ